MPNLLPRNNRALYSRAVVRSLGASVLLHAFVLTLFAFGISRGFRVAQPDTGKHWLELGADIRPASARATSKSVVAAQLQVQNPVVQSTTPDAVNSAGTTTAVETDSETRASAEASYVTELANLLNKAKRYPRESIAR